MQRLTDGVLQNVIYPPRSSLAVQFTILHIAPISLDPLSGTKGTMASISEKHVRTGEVDTNESSDFKGINEKALLRKLDYRLLPPLTILYLLSFLDRSNVGNARLEGMTDDVNMCTFESRCSHDEAKQTYSGQSIFDRLDSIFHWICPF